MHMYCKNCKKHTGNTFPKTLIPISKNRIKGKSKCAIFVTKRTFIHEIEGKYDLESDQKFIFSFLLTDVIKEHGDLLREAQKIN